MISAALAGLIGVTIGSGITFLTNWIQQRGQDKRDLKKLAYDMAEKEYDRLYEIIRQKGGDIMPLESFVTYYLKYTELVVDKNKLDSTNLKKLREYRTELYELYKKDRELFLS